MDDDVLSCHCRLDEGNLIEVEKEGVWKDSAAGKTVASIAYFPRALLRVVPARLVGCKP